MQDPPIPTLRALLKSAARRDEKAISTLYRTYQRFVFAFICRFVSNEELAKEVLNDTFLAAFRKPDSYDYSSKFSTWLCGIARNKALSAVRQEGRIPDTASLDGEEALQVAATAADPQDHLDSADLREVLSECLKRLSEDHRKTAQLVYCGEMKQDDVAELLGCPVGTIKSRLHQARAQLAKCVRRRYAERGAL